MVLERPTQSSDLEPPDEVNVNALLASNPLEKDYKLEGRDACSGTKYNNNESNWWSALFDSSY